MIKPIIKWVGGKRQLLPIIQDNLPKKFNHYYEPFVGGGALLFSLKEENSTISDYNKELINVYQVIKHNLSKLIEDLQKHKNNKDYYYNIRALDREDSFKNISAIKRASRFIYLNKTCFNGLYRVNKNNQFNVPYGKYKNPNWINEENLLKISKYLQDVNIIQGDFEVIKPLIKKGDFIYLDPPYIPLTSTANFTSYTDNGFDMQDHIRLKEFCDYIDSIGAFFLLSNSYTDITLELYKEYKIVSVMAKRNINRDASKRGKIKEILVKNY